MGKLWQKNIVLDKLMEEFTVGNDYLIDSKSSCSRCLWFNCSCKNIGKEFSLSKEELVYLKKSWVK